LSLSLKVHRMALDILPKQRMKFNLSFHRQA
jgi:hypothetical protein